MIAKASKFPVQDLFEMVPKALIDVTRQGRL